MRRINLSESVRNRLERYPSPFSSHYGVVPKLPDGPVSIMPVAAVHDAALSALGQLTALTQGSRHGYVATRVLRRQEAVSSSSIEGTHATLDELLEIEATEEADRDTAGSHDAKLVRNYALALEAMLPRVKAFGHDAFDADLVLGLHRGVMAEDTAFKGVPGAWREKVVWIGGTGRIEHSTFNPAPPGWIAACLAEHIEYLRTPCIEAGQSLPARMAIAHAHFEAIHPFTDGNGRVGRLILPLMMAAEGLEPLYIAACVEARKDAYYDALKEAQQKDRWETIIGFVCDAIVSSVAEVAATRKALDAMAERWRRGLGLRADAVAHRLIDILPDWPALTVRRVEELLATTFQTANQAVAQLVEAGILRERTGQRRNRIFAAEEVLRVFNRPFGIPPEEALEKRED